MSVKITVPALGESITEATIAKWYKKPGDAVKVDELLVELETEKVTLEVNAPASGVISEIIHPEGDAVKVGELIGSMEEGAVAPAPATEAVEKVSSSVAMVTAISSEPILSPSAQKIAQESGLDVSSLSGTGKDGRVTKGDVLAAISNPATNLTTNNSTSNSMTQVATINPTSLSAASDSRREERVPMSRLRKTIAQRLKDSQNTAAILTTFNEIDMFNVMSLRSKYKDRLEKKYGVKLGFMSFFVKAAVNALKEIPSVNAQIDGDTIIYKNYYDIGVAVGTEQGLVVPVIRSADQLSFAGCEAAISDYAKKARDGKLAMSDLTGGTFSITNGGVYGSLMSTPIINPPQSAILGMHKIMDRPVVIDGKIEIRPMMYVALSYDHRMIDGKEAVSFLVKIKEAVEDPERLLLEV